jgi:hypothetical protein
MDQMLKPKLMNCAYGQDSEAEAKAHERRGDEHMDEMLNLKLMSCADGQDAEANGMRILTRSSG